MRLTEAEIMARVNLPPKFKGLRQHQVDAINDIMSAYESEVETVYLDAPVGSGKTVIAEVVRQLLNAHGMYVCTDKKLQQQFLDDFPYASVLMGRGNYPTERMGDARDERGRLLVSAEDCEGGDACMYCHPVSACPYQCARDAATENALAVLNTAYFMTEANTAKPRFGKGARELVIVDEADVLEDSLMNYVEFEVPQWIWRRLGLMAPKKGVRKPALIRWLREADLAARDAIEGRLFPDPKERRRCRQFMGECARVAGELERDMDVDEETLQSDEEAVVVSTRWLRDYDTKTVKLKPVIVGPYGSRVIWRHSQRWLLMSGTFVSAEQRAQDTGMKLDFEVVTVPMTFPVENRPIVMAPVANITRKSEEGDYADLAYAIEQISRRHQGERILVHTVSKALAERLVRECELPGRTVVSYASAMGKQDALDEYMSVENSILFAQSMDRGVDLPGDACRVVVVAKIPFPSLGDRRIRARMSLQGGQSWYQTQTVATIVQMTGRGVRSERDHATSYILDKQFATNLWSKARRLLPEWWRDAVDTTIDNRWLMRSYAGTKHALD
jgi:Rad3-related DNA helicase